jgi:hypothetical protein
MCSAALSEGLQVRLSSVALSQGDNWLGSNSEPITLPSANSK